MAEERVRFWDEELLADRLALVGRGPGGAVERIFPGTVPYYARIDLPGWTDGAQEHPKRRRAPHPKVRRPSRGFVLRQCFSGPRWYSNTRPAAAARIRATATTIIQGWKNARATAAKAAAPASRIGQ